MKQKISVTVEEKTLKLVEQIIATGIFRNKSHAVEFGLNKVLNEKNGDKENEGGRGK